MLTFAWRRFLLYLWIRSLASDLNIHMIQSVPPVQCQRLMLCVDTVLTVCAVTLTLRSGTSHRAYHLAHTLSPVTWLVSFSGNVVGMWKRQPTVTGKIVNFTLWISGACNVKDLPWLWNLGQTSREVRDKGIRVPQNWVMLFRNTALLDVVGSYASWR